MKRSEMILKMERFYNIRHVMLESGYISLTEFMTEFLDHIEYNGMLPPYKNEERQYPDTLKQHSWEEEKD